MIQVGTIVTVFQLVQVSNLGWWVTMICQVELVSQVGGVSHVGEY